MNLFELFVKIGVDDQASGQLKKITSSIGNGLKTAAKVGLGAITTVSAGIAGLTKLSIDQYKEYEQLVGGAQLMFGDAYDYIADKAKNAFSTVQMSQNEYLQQVNGFATGLKTALNGNEQAAAELADRIITAEADIIAATGNTAENVQNAFNGIMKSNFTMLDNLQLGITPTKEGFQEVIDKVNEWNASMGNATNYQMGNLADMQSALVDYIEMQGLAGYAAKEAAGTISGSWSMVLGAWQNLLTGFANEDADVGELLDKVIDSVFTFGENLVPRIKTIMSKMFDLAKEALPEFLSGLWENISKGITYIKDNMPIILADLPLLITGFFENSSDMLEIGFMIIQRITESIISSLPRILASATELISTLVKGLADNMPQLINSAVEMIILIADALTRPETLIPLLDAALSVIVALADALYLIADNEALRTTTYQIMLNLMDFLIEGIPLIVSAAWDIIVALVSALAESFITNLETMPDLLDMFVKWLTDEERLGGIFDAGVDIIKKLMAGIVATLPMIKEEIEEFFNNLFNGEEKIGLSGDFSNLSGNSEIEFNKSGLAKVGSNTINAIESNSSMSNKTHPNSVNLVMPDGTKFAEYLLPDLEGVSRARGTPIIQPT